MANGEATIRVGSTALLTLLLFSCFPVRGIGPSRAAGTGRWAKLEGLKISIVLDI